MKISKHSIRLLPEHPSLLLDLPEEGGVFPPVVVDASGTLVDGYRRYRIQPGVDIEAVRMDLSTNVFEVAMAMNLRTRAWDDLDCFLWDRWGRSLGADPQLKVRRFPSELQLADASLLRLLAARRLTLRQAALILQTPLPYRPFFQRFLSECVRLNNNESASFIDLSVDLKKMLKLKNLEDVVRRVESAAPDPDPRSRGERLLKGMRVLRYPYYQKKYHEFVDYWRELDLGRNVRANGSRFLERGKLEITVTSASYQEMKEALAKVSESVQSAPWRKIWEE